MNVKNKDKGGTKIVKKLNFGVNNSQTGFRSSTGIFNRTG